MKDTSRHIITIIAAILTTTLLMACTKKTVIELTVDQPTNRPDVGTSTETGTNPTPKPTVNSNTPDSNTPTASPKPTPSNETEEPTATEPNDFFPTPEPTVVTIPEPEQRSRIFKTEELGTLITAPEGTTIAVWQKPEWVKAAIAESGFVRPNGKIYTVLVYRKSSEETIEDWMSRGELGDAYVSPQTVLTKNGATGYVYTSNDHGAIPVVHITVASREFVYYFHSDESEKEVPEDFLTFMREIEVQ